MSRHTLAETQVAGFGLAAGSVVDRLSLIVDERHATPAVVLSHERDHHPDPLGDGAVRTIKVAESRVTPTGCDGPRKIEPGWDPFADRVTVTHHDHAPRAYVRHERQSDGEWRCHTEWEIHPAEGVVRTLHVEGSA